MLMLKMLMLITGINLQNGDIDACWTLRYNENLGTDLPVISKPVAVLLWVLAQKTTKG